MKWITAVEPPSRVPQIAHTHRLLLMGSCFTSSIGELLREAKFQCDINPFGVLYNPISIASALREIAVGKHYTQEDLFFHGQWHSPMHHGDFSAATSEETLARIHIRLQHAHAHLPQTDYLLITFGTAYVYQAKADGRVVGNCHKLPEHCFTRRRITAEEMVEAYTSLFALLMQGDAALGITGNPHLKILFTVSPIRHAREGMHANQLSKAVLLLAIDQLQTRFPDSCFYFPAYELMMDELRDYRFYADDLLHPSSVAIQYIGEQFFLHCLTSQAQEAARACIRLAKELAHRPLHPDAVEYRRFLEQLLVKMHQLGSRYPYLAFDKEKELCHTRLNNLPTTWAPDA
ncbi:MAG: GSCFA domain-containing protein [Prevotellaceae bacterium]|jgi:hypothetical protein|nr:GSCFA domain-containing protein [Prevotellaceae bacterium]